VSDDGSQKATAEVVEQHGSALTADTVVKHVERHDTQRSTIHRKPRHVDVQLSVVNS